jgi:hypothetical protein
MIADLVVERDQPAAFDESTFVVCHFYSPILAVMPREGGASSYSPFSLHWIARLRGR